MDDDTKEKNIDDEIKNVTKLCGQIEYFVKNTKINTVTNQKPNVSSKVEDFSVNNRKNLTSNKKHHKGRKANLSMDDKMHLDTGNFKLFNKTQLSTIKNSSVDTKNKKLNSSKIVTISDKKQNKVLVDKNKNEHLHAPVDPALVEQKFEVLLNRFKECETNRIKKINEKKKEIEIKEAKEIKKVPYINPNSKKKVCTQDDFLTRQEKYQTEIEKKKEILKEEALKKKEKILAEEEKVLNSLNKKKLDKEYIEQKINNMLEWEEKRKNKIEKLKEEEPLPSFKPKINKKSGKILSGKNDNVDNNQELVERLYIKDIQKRKQKKEILEEIYTPSFIPTLNTDHKNLETEPKEKNFNGVHLDHMSNKKTDAVEVMLKERIKMIKNKKIE